MENKKINNSILAGQELKKLDEPTPLEEMINDSKAFKVSAVVGCTQDLKEVEKHRPYTITGACAYTVHPSFDREKIINQMKMEMLEKLKPLIDLFVVEPIMIGRTNLKGVLTVYLTEEQIKRLRESQENKEKE
jgi:hypothetical protein